MAATPLNADALKDAFDVFNRQSDRLEETYRELRDQVESLTRKLANARSARLKELAKQARLSRRLSNLLESLPGAIVVLDQAGIVRESNSEAIALFSKPLHGCSWASIVRRDVRASSGEDGNLQLHDGRWLSLSRRPLAGGDGEVLLLADITESRHVSALRERRARLGCIGEMTAKFAHQVRTPLASAMLYAGQLEPVSGRQQKIAQRISARLADIGRMVNDMLGFAAGGRSADDVVELKALLHSVVTTIDSQLHPKTTLTVTQCDDSLCISGNPDALKGALLNLVTNAQQACSDGARISLVAERAGDSALIRVSDNGPGIPDDVQPRIFEPFFTTRPQGTGLGLAVVHAVITAHQGTVSVTSCDAGSTFTLVLPALDTTDTRAPND